MDKTTRPRRYGLTVLLIIIVSTVAFAPVAAVYNPTTVAQTADVSSDIPNEQIFEGSSDGQIEVWNRFAYTLRSDDTDASAQLEYPNDVIGATGFGEKDLVATFGARKNPIGVFEAGDQVTLSFKDSRASSGDLRNQNRVEVVAARLTGSGNGAPSTVSDGLDLLGDIDNANENASFQMIEEDTSFDGSGELTTTFTPSQAGQYIVFASVHQSNRDGFEVNNGDISINGDVLLVGTDHLSVAESTSTVDVSGGVTGSSVDFDIDASNAFSSSTDVTHAVALYDKDAFEGSRFEISVDEAQLGPDFDLSADSEFRHSIESVNGVADVEDGITVNGVDLSDGRVGRTLGAGQIVDFVASDLGTDTTSTTPIKEGGTDDNAYETLDGSVTAISGADPQATVSVETFSNFSAGEYQYVVYSMRDDQSSITSVETGTISLIQPSASASTTVTGTSSGQLTIGGQSTESTEITFDNAQTNAEVFVGELDTLPDSTGGLSSIKNTVTNADKLVTGLEINAPADQGATVNVTLKQSRLELLDVSASDLTVVRYHDGNWTERSTSVVSTSSSTATIEFATPGFSTFAVVSKTTDDNGGGGGGGGGGSGGGGGIGGIGETPTDTPGGTDTPGDTDTADGTDTTTDDTDAPTDTTQKQSPSQPPTESDTTAPGPETTTEDGAGFGVVLAIIALVSAGLVARRRN